jgi:hypothetical protein
MVALAGLANGSIGGSALAIGNGRNSRKRMGASSTHAKAAVRALSDKQVRVRYS